MKKFYPVTLQKFRISLIHSWLEDYRKNRHKDRIKHKKQY